MPNLSRILCPHSLAWPGMELDSARTAQWALGRLSAISTAQASSKRNCASGVVTCAFKWTWRVPFVLPQTHSVPLHDFGHPDFWHGVGREPLLACWACPSATTLHGVRLTHGKHDNMPPFSASYCAGLEDESKSKPSKPF